MILSDKPAKRCLTASAWTVFKGKTLLIKHKKLKIWLAPGGHVDENELPHHAAEREFFEETGVKGRAISSQPLLESGYSEFLPLPFISNLHWINKPRGESFCEQHIVFGFFVEVVDDSSFGRQLEETDDIGWFSREQIAALETHDNIKEEAYFVFDHFPQKTGGV